MISLGFLPFKVATLTTCLCFLFFFSSFLLASFLAWSVGFINFPPFVVFVDRFPILKLGGAALKELLKDLKRFHC